MNPGGDAVTFINPVVLCCPRLEIFCFLCVLGVRSQTLGLRVPVQAYVLGTLHKGFTRKIFLTPKTGHLTLICFVDESPFRTLA